MNIPILASTDTKTEGNIIYMMSYYSFTRRLWVTFLDRAYLYYGNMSHNNDDNNWNSKNNNKDSQ